jgi:hypothetical protein
MNDEEEMLNQDADFFGQTSDPDPCSMTVHQAEKYMDIHNMDDLPSDLHNEMTKYLQARLRSTARK